MKLKIDLTAQDLIELNDPELTNNVIQQAHMLLEKIFEERDQLIKCSITIDGDKQ